MFEKGSFLAIRNHKDSRKPRTNTKAHPWSLKEKEATLKFFRSYIKNGRVPNMADAELCIQQSNNILNNRTWRQIEYFDYNQIQKIKKLKKPN